MIISTLIIKYIFLSFPLHIHLSSTTQFFSTRVLKTQSEPHILWRPQLRIEAPIHCLERLRFKWRSWIEVISLQFGTILIEFHVQSTSRKIRLSVKLSPQFEQGLNLPKKCSNLKFQKKPTLYSQSLYGEELT